jgi:hypothetical protein
VLEDGRVVDHYEEMASLGESSWGNMAAVVNAEPGPGSRWQPDPGIYHDWMVGSDTDPTVPPWPERWRSYADNWATWKVSLGPLQTGARLEAGLITPYVNAAVDLENYWPYEGDPGEVAANIETRDTLIAEICQLYGLLIDLERAFGNERRRRARAGVPNP